MAENDIIPHLFRTEYSKMVSVLTKSFGIEYVELAEDIVSETFMLALDIWPYKGLPTNPTAWLYTVAKNKVINYFKRKNTLNKKVSHRVVMDMLPEEMSIDFSENNIVDSQLQMFFAICHPFISVESQICMALRILCGLGLDEIADAFLSNKETIHKRLQRAKKSLRQSGIKIEMPAEKDINERVDAVLHTIYLVFSEGYYSESNSRMIRSELCADALNLAYLILSNASTNLHSTNALLSLMCFQSSRLEARMSDHGEIILYDDQDRSLWDKELIEKGFYYLQQASKWEIKSPYYIEASIAYWHTVESTHPDKWISILFLYDVLLTVNNSPAVTLNRIWAYSKVHGALQAIDESEKQDFKKNHFYFILMAELYGHFDKGIAINYLSQAYDLCKTIAEKDLIQKKILTLQANQLA